MKGWDSVLLFDSTVLHRWHNCLTCTCWDTPTLQRSKQSTFLLFGTNLWITSKLHHLCFKKV